MADMIDDPGTATAVLRQEHELILAVVDVLERVIATDTPTGSLDDETASMCASFIRLYADSCHHGKEEDLLFPALAEHGLPADQGPIAVMLHEHEQGRALVRTMFAALDRARSGDDSGADDCRTAARGYIELIRDHIAKENAILFEMADNLLVGADCANLRDRYAEVDAGRFEGRSKPELEQLAADLLAH